MIAPLLALALSAPCPPPLAENPAPIATKLEANATTFRAANDTERTKVLLFGSHEVGIVSNVVLAPGASVSFAFSRSIVDEVLVEVLSLEPEGPRSEGTYALFELRHNASRTLWVTDSRAWFGIGDSCAEFHSGTSLLPRGAVPPSNGRGAGSFDATNGPTWIHVPEGPPIVPQNTPPKVRRKPLPPI